MKDVALDIVTVLEALDLEPPTRDGKINCPMPTHEDYTASCHIYGDGHWHCYGCGQRGDAIGLVMKVTGQSYSRSLMYLARFIDIDPEDVPAVVRSKGEVREPEYVDLTDRFYGESHAPFDPDYEWSRKALVFAMERWQIGPDVLVAFDVRAAANALWIPHFHEDGRVVGVKVRNISTGDKVSMKGSRFTNRLYQPPHGARRPKAFVVEGEPDTWSAYAVVGDDGNVYGLPSGASTIRKEWVLALLRHHDDITLCFDNDKAGEAARARFSELLVESMDGNFSGSNKLLRQLRVPEGCKDFTEAVMRGWRP